MGPIYIPDPDADQVIQPPGEFVAEAEDEFDGEEVTWTQVAERAWELAEADK